MKKMIAKVDPISCENLQRYLFTLGYSWWYGVRVVRYTGAYSLKLNFSKDMIISMCPSKAEWLIMHDKCEELILPPEFSEKGWLFVSKDKIFLTVNV